MELEMGWGPGGAASGALGPAAALGLVLRGGWIWEADSPDKGGLTLPVPDCLFPNNAPPILYTQFFLGSDKKRVHPHPHLRDCGTSRLLRLSFPLQPLDPCLKLPGHA